MPRMPKPWRRKSVGGGWYSQEGGRQHFLAPANASFETAQEVLGRLLSAQPIAPPKQGAGLSVGDVVAHFMTDSRRQAERGEIAATTHVEVDNLSKQERTVSGWFRLLFASYT